MKRIATVAVGVALMLALVAPGAASAASSSTCQAYNPQSCIPNNQTKTAGSGTLPFTGLDVVLLIVGGGTLLGAGLVVRTLSRRVH